MSKSIIINGVTYEVDKLQAPLSSDPSQLVVFPLTDDATAQAASVKDGETFYAGGQKVEGTMPVKGAGGGTIATKTGTVKIEEGYYNGQGSVSIDSNEQAKLIPANIREGVTVLGVAGTMSGSEGVKAQTKTVTPTKSVQVVQPDAGYTHLVQVEVGAIPAQYITTTDANAGAEHIVKDKTAYVNGKKVTGTHTDPTLTLTSGVLTIK